MPDDHTLEISLRCGIDFILDIALDTARRLDVDILSSVLLCALLREEFGQDLSRQAPGWSRGVTVYRIAQVLQLPYETTRRRFRRLKALGLCRVSAGATIEAARNPGLSDCRNHIAVKTLRLAHPGRPGGHRELHGGRGRRPADAGLQYFLDTLTMLRAALELDSLDVLLLLCMYRLNTRPLEDGRDLASVQGLWIDEVRHPVSRYRLAKMMGLPYETIRRRVADLVHLGYCRVATRDRLLVPAQVIRTARIADAADAARVFARRMVERLASDRPFPS